MLFGRQAKRFCSRSGSAGVAPAWGPFLARFIWFFPQAHLCLAPVGQLRQGSKGTPPVFFQGPANEAISRRSAGVRGLANPDRHGLSGLPLHPGRQLPGGERGQGATAAHDPRAAHRFPGRVEFGLRRGFGEGEAAAGAQPRQHGVERLLRSALPAARGQGFAPLRRRGRPFPRIRPFSHCPVRPGDRLACRDLGLAVLFEPPVAAPRSPRSLPTNLPDAARARRASERLLASGTGRGERLPLVQLQLLRRPRAARPSRARTCPRRSVDSNPGPRRCSP